MYLELSITNGNGYISTISEDGKSTTCKPVSSHEIEDMLDAFQKDDKYRVTSFGSSNGDQRHTVKEAIKRNFTKDANEKADIELSRFNQDCRKRALDLAHNEANSQRAYSHNPLSGNPQSGSIGIDVIKLADKYYEWLTKEV